MSDFFIPASMHLQLSELYGAIQLLMDETFKAKCTSIAQGAIRRYTCRRSVTRPGDLPNLIFSTSRIALPPLKTMTLPVDSLTVTAVALVTAVIPAAA